MEEGGRRFLEGGREGHEGSAQDLWDARPVAGEDGAAVQVARDWVAAVNAQHVPGVVTRSARDIVLIGPLGEVRGQPALREWVERGGLQMTIERVFAAAGRVVFLHQAVWRDRRGLAIAEATIVHRFEVEGDRVRAVVRFGSLQDALADAGLSGADERPAIEAGSAGG